MGLKYKYSFFVCLTVSLFFHGAVVLLVHPVIAKKATPVILSWLDVLAPMDMTLVSSPEKNVSGELFGAYPGREYFSYSARKEHIFFSEYRKEPFGIGIGIEPFTREEACALVNLKKNVVPFWDLYGTECMQVTYRAGITSKGRILFATPLTLSLNSPTPLYIEEHLKKLLVFSGKGYFYWTMVKVVIE